MQAIKATALALCVGSAAAFSAPPSMQLRDAKLAVAPRDADALTGCARTAHEKRVPGAAVGRAHVRGFSVRRMHGICFILTASSIASPCSVPAS